MKICVIGFGVGGMTAARHIMHEDRQGKHECIVFEQTDKPGGTWVYTDDVGNDEFGLPIHTSMYKSLRTNSPKEVMSFPDFPIPDYEESFIAYEEVFKFLEDYIEKFDIKKYVKFNHLVTRVHPIGDEWEVDAKDLKANLTKTYIFDVIMVCNGHYHTPQYPNIPGMETFTGIQIHSHDYRIPDKFKDKKVLIIGLGPSGADISLDVATAASEVIISKSKTSIKIEDKFPKNVKVKSETTEINGKCIIFEDGTREDDVEALIYCTGFKFIFPFLTEECGIRVIENRVQPLFKHLIHIDRPTLCILGIPYYICTFPLLDLQTRIFLKILEGGIELPTKKEMLEDVEKEMEEKLRKGFKSKQFHLMGSLQGDYFKELAAFGNVTPIPPFMADLHTFATRRLMNDITNYRKDIFKIIDDNTFIKIN